MDEGHKFIRLMLVLSGLSPVFILWAIRGVEGVDHKLWAAICLQLFVWPNAALKYMFWQSRKKKNIRSIEAVRVEAHEEQLITYLLAMMLPLIEVSFTNFYDDLAAVCALTFTTYLFYAMRLHYMNLFFVMTGFRFYEAHLPDRDGGGSRSFVIISKKGSLDTSQPIMGYRLGANVLMEAAPHAAEIPTGQD